MRKVFFIWLSLFLWLVSAKAQSGHEITINITDYQSSELLMTSYYGDKVILVDTAKSFQPGTFIFKGKEALPQGIYMAVNPKKQKLFEYVIGKDQHFTLSTDTLNYTQNLAVDGSEENELFFNYLKLSEQLYLASQDFIKRRNKSPQGSEAYKSATRQIDSINQLSGDYKIDIINSYPNLLVSDMFNAMRDVEIPKEILNSKDSLAAYRYYKQHYWDFLDLSDTRLLRTPMLARKTDQYFKQAVPNHPDSVIIGIDKLIKLSRPSEEVKSWLLWHFTSVYQNPEFMGFDVVFIHLVDAYFSKEEVINLTPSILQTLEDRANKMRPLVLGAPAPKLMMVDTSGNYKSFSGLSNDFIILYFWDFDCGICKKESTTLKELYKNPEFDIEVFAINVNGELDIWKERIVENEFTWINVNGTRSVTEDFHDLYDAHGTPVIFILDKEHNIIAKHIAADQIEGFLSNYE